MRVDIRTDDLWEAARCKVFLDGEELPLCVMADEEKGEAEVYLKHDGQLDFYDPPPFPENMLLPENMVLYVVRGRIEVRRP